MGSPSAFEFNEEGTIWVASVCHTVNIRAVVQTAGEGVERAVLFDQDDNVGDLVLPVGDGVGVRGTNSEVYQTDEGGNSREREAGHGGRATRIGGCLSVGGKQRRPLGRALTGRTMFKYQVAKCNFRILRQKVD